MHKKGKVVRILGIGSGHDIVQLLPVVVASTSNTQTWGGDFFYLFHFERMRAGDVFVQMLLSMTKAITTIASNFPKLLMALYKTKQKGPRSRSRDKVY